MVEIITAASGDWVVVKVDGETVITGHHITIYDLMTLANKFGAKCSHREISDEEMEELE